jgi:hypothetical protein
MRSSRHLGGLLLAAVVGTAATVGILTTSASGGPEATTGLLDPTVKIPFENVAIPGEKLYLTGGDWLNPTNCANKIEIKIRDSANHTASAGKLKPKNPDVLYEGQEYPAALDGSVTVPNGLKPGPGKVWGYQRWQWKFAGDCKTISTQSSPKVNVTISGELGNDPPVITNFTVPDLAQAVPGQMSWTASEACDATIHLEQELAPGIFVDFGNLTAPAVAGSNQLPFDATMSGQPLPIGVYRAVLQCQDQSSSRSAPKVDRFTVRVG